MPDEAQFKGLRGTINSRLQELQQKLERPGIKPKEREELQGLINYWRERMRALDQQPKG